MKRISLGCVLLSVGCGGAAMSAAERGDRPALRAAIAQKHAWGKLSNGEAADLARAVAAREIANAKDEGSALARLDETRACTQSLDGALADRMRKRDGAGAEAALTRLEDGTLSRSDGRSWLDDPDDRWRAIGVRTLTDDDDGERRRRALLDPSPRVRRSAIRASAEAHDPADLDILFETTTVDPELVLRSEALRAMSAIVRRIDREATARASQLALRLRDLWTTGDDAIREDIAVAWALAPVYANGGRAGLRGMLATQDGPGAIAAAGVVLRVAPGDRELAASATAVVARTIGEGSRRDRLHAVAIARLSGLELDALRKARADEDVDVRIAVLGRLTAISSDRDRAIHDLEALAVIAKPGAVAEERARAAREALAIAGDLRIQAWIEKDMFLPDARTKARAAIALAALGRPARAAPLLADEDVSVRTRTACTLLHAR